MCQQNVQVKGVGVCLGVGRRDTVPEEGWLGGEGIASFEKRGLSIVRGRQEVTKREHEYHMLVTNLFGGSLRLR